MQVGTLVKISNTGKHDGCLGIVVDIESRAGFRTEYTVYMNTKGYKIALHIEQIWEVLCK